MNEMKHNLLDIIRELLGLLNEGNYEINNNIKNE